MMKLCFDYMNSHVREQYSTQQHKQWEELFFSSDITSSEYVVLEEGMSRFDQENYTKALITTSPLYKKLQCFGEHDQRIEAVIIRPDSFEAHADSQQIENPDYTVDFDPWDGLFETVIYVTDAKKIAAVKKKLMNQLEGSIKMGSERIGYNYQSFTFSHSQYFRGELRVKITTRKGEAWQDRGDIPTPEQPQKIGFMNELVDTILAQSDSDPKTFLSALAREFQGILRIIDFEGDQQEFLRGSTVVDLAAKTFLLLAYVTGARYAGGHLAFYDQLLPGERIFLETPNLTSYTLTPEMLCFARMGKTRQQILRLLPELYSREERIQKGYEFLSRLTGICGFDSVDEITDFLFRSINVTKNILAAIFGVEDKELRLLHDRDEILDFVGSGSIEPLDFLAIRLNLRKQFCVSITVPDSNPEHMFVIAREFTRDALNVSQILRSGTVIQVALKCGDSKANKFQILKTLFRLSYNYQVKITSDSFIKF